METERPVRSVVFLRCPKDLREQIEVAAARSLRTMNSEIVWRLKTTFEQSAADKAANKGARCHVA